MFFYLVANLIIFNAFLVNSNGFRLPHANRSHHLADTLFEQEIARKSNRDLMPHKHRMMPINEDAVEPIAENNVNYGFETRTGPNRKAKYHNKLASLRRIKWLNRKYMRNNNDSILTFVEHSADTTTTQSLPATLHNRNLNLESKPINDASNNNNNKKPNSKKFSMNTIGYFAIIVVMSFVFVVFLLIFMYVQQREDALPGVNETNSHLSEVRQMVSSRKTLVKRYIRYHFDEGVPAPDQSGSAINQSLSSSMAISSLPIDSKPNVSISLGPNNLNNNTTIINQKINTLKSIIS